MQFKEYKDNAIAMWVKQPYWLRALVWFLLGLLTGGALL